MKRAKIMLILLLVLSLYGCVPQLSLYPLWDKEHLANELALRGTWVNADGTESIQFMEKDQERYLVVYSMKDEKESAQSSYTMHAVRLDGTLFFDFEPDQTALEERLKPELYLPLVNAHFLARANVQGDELRMAVLDDEAFLNKVKNEKIDIRYERPNPANDDHVLSAKTAEIQKFFSKHAADQDLWEDKTFHRMNN
ncbi:MAG: hypothetical protein LAO21_08625 [Acidobacteriia bacterium]|nr:hypothetical protein [Terriglobia bacterium]